MTKTTCQFFLPFVSYSTDFPLFPVLQSQQEVVGNPLLRVPYTLEFQMIHVESVEIQAVGAPINITQLEKSQLCNCLSKEPDGKLLAKKFLFQF